MYRDRLESLFSVLLGEQQFKKRKNEGMLLSNKKNKLLIHITWVILRYIMLSGSLTQEYILNDCIYTVLEQTKLTYGGIK